LAAVCLATKFGYINHSGGFIIRSKFEAAGRFCEGFAGVKFNGKSGFIRRDGSWLAAPEFNEVHSFDNGRAYARIGSEWVFVDTAGRIHDRI
jgi:WG containing repeat